MFEILDKLPAIFLYIIIIGRKKLLIKLNFVVARFNNFLSFRVVKYFRMM